MKDKEEIIKEFIDKIIEFEKKEIIEDFGSLEFLTGIEWQITPDNELEHYRKIGMVVKEISSKLGGMEEFVYVWLYLFDYLLRVKHGVVVRFNKEKQRHRWVYAEELNIEVDIGNDILKISYDEKGENNISEFYEYIHKKEKK